MSRKERDRIGIMVGIQQGELTLRAAVQVLGLSYRQTRRGWRRYQAQGDAGLVHRARGRPGPRRKPAALRARILARYQERYGDFGPTLAAEYLREQDGLAVDHETLRRWLLAEGVWTVRRRRQRHRQWRERKACFGEMVQMDGSHHDWFEGRRAPCVLMVAVDDATNRLRARFFEEETTHASYDTFEDWVRRHGVPRSVYVDRDSIYRCEGPPSVADQLAGRAPQTQFGRAMEQLGVRLLLACSPQAKGRVERMNGVLQDRLVKALRLEGINDLETANRYLDRVFLPALNRRLARQPAQAADVHRPVPANLDEVLSWEAARVVQRDWTVAWQGRWFQIERSEERRNLVGRPITVRRLRDGRLQLVDRGQKLRWRELPARPPRVQAAARAGGHRGRVKPGAEHPWRVFGIAAGQRYWRGARLGGRPPPGPPVAAPRPPTEGSPGMGPRRLYPVGDRPPKGATI